MKTLLMIAVLAGLLVYIDAAAVCKTPVAKYEVDWSKVSKGVWYEILNINSDVDHYVDCFVEANITKTSYGFTSDAVIYNEDFQTRASYFRKHSIRQESGLYLFQSNKSYTDVIEDLVGDVDDDVKESLDNFNTVPKLLMTDYKNYFIIAFCSEGKWIIWPKIRKPDPSAKDILRIWHALNDHEIYVDLYLSGCARMKFRDDREKDST